MNFYQIILVVTLNISNGWQIVSLDGPEPRYINQLVYAEDALVLFGGKNSSSKGFNDLWEWRDSKWNFIGNGATGRWDHCYAYMENQKQLFLFGGRTFQRMEGKEERVDLNDNWIYKNREWKKLEIDSPEPRSSHSITYFQNKNIVVLFGGRNKDKIMDDTWAFDGKKWSRLEMNGPGKRYGHTMSYDPASHTVFLFGGFDGENLLNDLWSFNGEEWIQVETKGTPSPRMAHAMQFDERGNAVLFGGWSESNSVADDLWILANGEWQRKNTEKMPKGRLSGAIGFDSTQNEFILFGGSTGFNGEFLPETWRLTL